MKQFPKLTLVGRDAEGEDAGSSGSGSRVSAAFELVGLDSLEADEKSRLQSSVQEILPKTPILGVARTPRLWDLRPVVAFGGEESPSIVRFVGPGVAASSHLAARVREIYDRLKEQSDLHSGVLGCGSLRGEFWYRRPLAESTLAHVLSSAQSLSEFQVFSIAYRVVEELAHWHERGIAHAHISSSNIWVAPQGKVFLFDPFIGFASIQANKGKTDYNLQSFAPELLRGESVSFSADIYGLGLVFRRLFLGLAKRLPYEANREKLERQVRPFLELSEAMLQADPVQRPSLAQVRRFVADAYQEFEKEAEESLKKRKSETSHKQGRIVKGPIADHMPLPTIAEVPPEPVKEAVKVAPVVSEKPVAPVVASPEVPPVMEQAAPPQYAAQQPPPAGYVYPNPGAQYAPPGYIHPAHMAPQGVAYHYGQPVMGPQAVYPYAQPHPYPPYQAAHPMYAGVPPQGVPFGAQGGVYQQPPIAPVGNPVNASQENRAIEKKDSNLLGLGLVLVLLLGGFWYYRTHGLGPIAQDENLADDLSDQAHIKDAWLTRIPSRMIPVAELALGPTEQARVAQSVIIESAVHGEEGLIGVNVPMLRVAFDGAWESELSVQDRRSAMAMGLAGLLKDRFPKDLQRVDGLHPGVILAATASAGKTASRILSSVPASVLTRLVPPYGPAFQELVKNNPNLNCGDDSVQRLARLGTRGAVDGLDDITLFLKTEQGAVREDASRRLRALAVMFSYNNGLSNSLLQVLLKHPNLSIDIPSIKWAKDWDLLNWKELEAGDQLYVLAGVAPARMITAENLGKLFAHPSDEMRGYAIGKALDRIRLGHPGAYDVFRIIQSDPGLLTPRQTVELAHLLERPEALQMPTIQSWLGTNPPIQIVAPLLLATASASKSTPLDTALAVYLKENKWKPELAVLRKLSQHPDDYTRFFAYNELYIMDDRETSKEFLSAAIRRETNKQNLNELQRMLSEINGN